jgi:hypothetical protein
MIRVGGPTGGTIGLLVHDNAFYLRIQRAVTAAPGVVHFIPSLVPAAHTNATRSSLSVQLTVSVPVTARKGEGGPASPLGPGGPIGPGYGVMLRGTRHDRKVPPV